MMQRLYTIGAYGFDQRRFLQRLEDARIDLFLDIRARRGVRGPQYAFANAARLEAGLAGAGIRYRHIPEVAPGEEIRRAQNEADRRAGIARRERDRLTPEFIRAYTASCLRNIDPREFVRVHCGEAGRPVLFCVEREPAACHRSLLAGHLAGALDIEVEHLTP